MKIERDAIVTVDIFQRADAFVEEPGRYLGLNTSEENPAGVHLIALDIGPIVAAHVSTGRFVFGDAAPPPDGSEITEIPILDRDAVEEIPVVGILYLGPPNVYAQECIVKMFGEQARFISHATPTKDQASQYTVTEPQPATLYVGTVPVADSVNIMACLDRVQAANNPLFPGIIGVLPDQLEEAQANAPTDGLAALITANVTATAAA